MKTYTYGELEKIELVKSGEFRKPIAGEFYLCHGYEDMQAPVVMCKSGPCEGIDGGRREILKPKEISMDSEYQIPVLVKASPYWADKVKPYFGKVILCRQTSAGYMAGPEGVNCSFSQNDQCLLLYPTQAQVEEEQAKLKADPLPSPVREALNAADLGCRREGVEKLIEAIYAHPPKAGV